MTWEATHSHTDTHQIRNAVGAASACDGVVGMRQTDVTAQARITVPRSAKGQIHFLVTGEQDCLIRSHARESSLTLTDYIVARCVSEDLGMLPLLQSELRSLFDELNRQGVNLNQMAHRINLLNDPADPRLDAALSELGPIIEEQRACLELVTDALEGIGIAMLGGDQGR